MDSLRPVKPSETWVQRFARLYWTSPIVLRGAEALSVLSCILFVVSSYVGSGDGSDAGWVTQLEGAISAMFLLDYFLGVIASGAGAHVEYRPTAMRAS